MRGRNNPSVIIDSGSNDNTWSNEFHKKLKAVEAPNRSGNIYDEMNSIMNRSKSKFSTVEEAVKDMQKRSGLTDYIEKSKSVSSQLSTTSSPTNKTKNAQNSQIATPKAFEKEPMIKSTVENFIRDTRGHSSVPAILEKVKEIHRFDVEPQDWEDENLIKFIHAKNQEESAKHPANNHEYSSLGKNVSMDFNEADPSNSDAFHGLNPVKF